MYFLAKFTHVLVLLELVNWTQKPFPLTLLLAVLALQRDMIASDGWLAGSNSSLKIPPEF